MNSREHERAQQLAIQATGLLKEGRCAEARSLYSQAAAWEKTAIEQLPADKIRTRGILGISLVSLLFKARDLAQAEMTAQAMLREPDLLPPTRRELDTMLEAIESEQAKDGATARLKDKARQV